MDNTLMDWKFDQIKIEREKWGDNKGKYKAEIQVARDRHNSICFSLSEDKIKELLVLVYPDLTFAVEEAANEFMEELRRQIA